jgi:hypothetical protein
MRLRLWLGTCWPLDCATVETLIRLMVGCNCDTHPSHRAASVIATTAGPSFNLQCCRQQSCFLLRIHHHRCMVWRLFPRHGDPESILSSHARQVGSYPYLFFCLYPILLVSANAGQEPTKLDGTRDKLSATCRVRVGFVPQHSSV